MLITNIVLFISAVCSATSIATSTGTSVATFTRSRRGIVYSNPEIRNNHDSIMGVQTTPRVASLQDVNSESPHYRGVKASDTQKVPYASPNHSGVGSASHAYGSVPPKRPLPYGSSSAQQIESHRKSPLASYFDTSSTPNTYRAATSAEKPLDASKLIVSPSLSNLQSESYSPIYDSFHQDKSIELAGFADFEYPSYTGIGKLISQDFQHQPGATLSAVQVPVYKTSYPLSKAGDYARTYAPSFPSSGAATLHQSSDKSTPRTKQRNEATVNVNGKKITVPVIRIQSNPDFDEILPAFESQPFLLRTSYQPAESDVDFTFGPASKFSLTPQSRNVSPFLSPLSSFQGQVVPIQTAGNSAQFPRYKGASIEVYPVPSSLPKAQGSYESLYSQPQLHFSKEHGSQPVNVQQNTVQSSISTEDVLDDVEIINKKNPEPHTPQPDEDDDEDERFTNPEKEYEHNSENDSAEQSGKHFKEPPTESDFRPSTSFPFKEYDEKFGKYRAQIDDEDSENKPHSRYKNYSANDDDEEDESSSEDRAEYVKSSKPSRDSYEEEDEEDEEESRKHERHEGSDNDSHKVEPKQSKYYGKDFEQEFEESYRKELPKHKYVHVKEVPEIDSYNNPKPSRRQQKDDNRSRVNHEHREESKNYGSRVSHRNRKTPRTGYRDNAAYGTDVSANKTPRVIYEEFFGYKDPETGRYVKHAKTEAVAIEKYLPAKQSPKEDNYVRATKYYKFKNPKIAGGLAYKNNPNLYLSANGWKSDKTLPEETLPGSNGIRQLSDPSDGASFYGMNVVNGQTRSLTNAEILRDLMGI
ncbi:hypothetical protein DMN91_007193 [Ooceraea biroi]|uniref:Uncharacterized protein n=1 Tax=Ooceraea biroi TaxID=2015173 RepID=A0A3L8DK76_OOCBI|nr:uncharacterized protein LOC105277727 [Ooceraea biroi]RLU20582.1 hypothetical protein DMN91_007193 [Ooceraea biroi]